MISNISEIKKQSNEELLELLLYYEAVIVAYNLKKVNVNERKENERRRKLVLDEILLRMNSK